MNVKRLSYEEQVECGFSHKATISYTELTSAGTTQTIQVAPSTGSFTQKVVVAAAVRVATAFTGSFATLTVELGDTGSTTRNLAASDVMAAAGTWYAKVGGTLNPFNTAGHFDAKFTSTVANVNTGATGQIEIYFLLLPLDKLSA